MQYASSGGNVAIAQQQQILSKASEAVNRVKQFVMEHFRDAVIVEERSVSFISMIVEEMVDIGGNEIRWRKVNV